MVQLVEALRCKLEGRGFHFLRGIGIFHYGTEVCSLSKRNDYLGYLSGMKAAGA